MLAPALVDLVGPAVRAPPPEADAAPLVDGVLPGAAPLVDGAPPDEVPLDGGAPPDAAPLDGGAPTDAAPLDVGVPRAAPLELPLTLECDLALWDPLPLLVVGCC